jgi:four helix bundle suffix protein
MTAPQRLDTVCKLTMGQAPDGESYNGDGDGLPLIAGAGDFGEVHPAAKKFTTAPGKVCCPGDIILGIRATIGEKVIADRAYCLGRGVAGLRARAGLDSRYLWHWLTHVAPILAGKAKGATFKQVNREDIGELAISLPQLQEQRRIAEVLDRTVDQMVQAARSGKQNIVEGSMASATSKEGELKLTNVARASLEELLEDYRDFLRTRGHALWEKNSREALFVRKLGADRDASYETYRTYIDTRPPEVVANIIICLIHQTNYLLDQQLRKLEQSFLKEGGLRERMTRARLEARQRGRRAP